jgi:hypothetical protein
MKLKHLAGLAAIALAPLAAHADQGDRYLEQQLAQLAATSSRVAQQSLASVPHLGQQHLVDLQLSEPSRLTRADVLRELMAAMLPAGGA